MHYVCVFVFICVCVCVRACTCMGMHACICLYTIFLKQTKHIRVLQLFDILLSSVLSLFQYADSQILVLETHKSRTDSVPLLEV